MYKVFNKYVLRTPMFSIDYFFQLTKNDTIAEEDILKEFSNPIIAEAVYLASPVLHNELIKLSNNAVKSSKEKQKIYNSFLKYLSRISTRSTPFGLFAGSSLGEISSGESSIVITETKKRHTRLDMDVTGLLFKKIASSSEIVQQLLFFPNLSLYAAAGQLRYIESHFNSKGILIYQIVEIEGSEYLEMILNSAKKGVKIETMVRELVSDEISYDEALEFVNELIGSQVLVSAIQQTVSGIENIDQLLDVLERLENVENLKEKLVLIKSKLSLLDLEIGNNTLLYNEILDILRSLDLKISENHIFQSDLYLDAQQNNLNSEVKPKILNALQFLNKISLTGVNTNLSEFKTKFSERYESREMPLSLVLDEETGIGYPIKYGSGDTNPLIDDIIFINKSKPGVRVQNITWSDMDSILLKKVMEAAKNDSKQIVLYDEEFSSFTVDWNNLQTTFSTISQIAYENEKMLISIEAFLGASAGNLLGRFCHGDSKISNFANEIIDFEEKYNSEKITAEIVHLPENRLGNILLRPSFRTYEIPYLSKSYKSSDNTLSVNDIFISVRNNKIILRSGKDDKEIIPRLTTAHNYSKGSLPMYRFLCDMQFNENRNYLRFDWGVLKNELLFFPRVTYGEIILCTAKWKIETKLFKELMILTDEREIIDRIEIICNSKKLNQFVYLVEGDNKLLINLKNVATLKMLFSEIKNKEWIILEEFLFEQTTLCKNGQNKNYINEIIFSFYKEESKI